MRGSAGERVRAQVNETTIAVQDARKQGATHRGYYGVHNAPALKADGDGLSQGAAAGWAAGVFWIGYAGALQRDGYAAYDGFDKDPGITRIIRVAGRMRGGHFHKALESEPERAGYVPEQLKALYAIERTARGEAPSVAGGACAKPTPWERAIRPIAVGRKNYLFAGSTCGSAACGG